MGATTAIAWTDHTFQPWMGCTKVSPGCDHCYAEALGKRTGRVQWGDDAPRVAMADAYWRNPIKWNRHAEAEGRQHRVFCASMADVFEDRDDLIPHRLRLFELIGQTPWLDWQLLTKRPQNVRRMVPYDWLCHADCWPPNAWLGTTVEDQERADERIPALLAVPAAVRFLSCEPLLGRLDLTPWLRPYDSDRVQPWIDWPYDSDPVQPWIDWIIVGGESGARARPIDLDHARDVRDQAHQYRVPFFFKQNSGRFPGSPGPDDLNAHKEFPRAT